MGVSDCEADGWVQGNGGADTNTDAPFAVYAAAAPSDTDDESELGGSTCLYASSYMWYAVRCML